MKFREFKLRRDPQCPVCGESPTIRQPIDYEQFCGVPTAVPEISVHELKAKLDAREKFLLLDVREPNEHEIARINGAELIPLREFPSRMAGFDTATEIVIHCHSGMRSAQAVRLMQDAGFEKVFNLAGGIDAWSEEIDQNVPRY
jgi:adenylyltransferase/sulfurtransferase